MLLGGIHRGLSEKRRLVAAPMRRYQKERKKTLLEA
jgi:hypothetical protein